MRNLFIGLLFVFLDFNLTINNSIIGLIPDFVGFIIIIKGLDELTEYNPKFEVARKFALGMAIYTGILYAMDLFGLAADWGILSFLLGLASCIIASYTTYLIVKGIKDMEGVLACDLNANPLYSAWIVMTVFSILAYFAILIPVLALLFVIANFIVGICFLVSFSKAKNLYYNRVNQQQEPL